MVNEPLKLGKGIFSRKTSRQEMFTSCIRLAALLTPALGLIGVLYIGGMALAGLQSLGYFPVAGLTHFSLDAYRALFSRQDFFRSLWLTLWVSFASTSIATIFALYSALLLHMILKNGWRSKQWVTFFYQLNLPVPHCVGAVGIFLLFSQSGLLARMAYAAGRIQSPADFPALVFDPYGLGIILEYIWKTSVFMGVILLAALQSVGEDYGAIASTLGANAWQRFRYVTLPLLRPALISSSILVFAFTFGGYEVPYILGQRAVSMLPVLAYREYSRVELTARPEAMAISMFIALAITLLVGLYMRFNER
ncbi:MAG: ABC transporter permease subunit [Anaerolineales bacterium]|nr:ABC transporter permease subunit [Anaerolineales bacterium]